MAASLREGWQASASQTPFGRPSSLLAIRYGTIHFVNVQSLTRAGLARFLVQIGSAAEKPVHSIPTGSHWGIYEVEVADGRIRHARPSPHDPDPGTMYGALPEIVDHATRVRTPAVRESYLREGISSKRSGRGAEPFVRVSWDRALDLVAAELERIRREYGNEAIFAGSYGWASSGRVNHPRTLLKRLLNLHGGFTDHILDYSRAAALVIVPHVVGSEEPVGIKLTSWDSIIEHTQLILSFGGMAPKNFQIDSGGMGVHRSNDWMRRVRAAGIEVVYASPMRSDISDVLAASWLPIRPNTDTAMMLGMAHTLYTEELHDRDFLNRYCVGFDIFARYLTGDSDGIAKSAEWAASICEIEAGVIRDLARRAARCRTMITLAYSLQRGDHGEQPIWMGITLAAMLGQIGLPGGGFGVGYGSMGTKGMRRAPAALRSIPTGNNPTGRFIPVARIADMLLSPGEAYDFNGKRYTYPDIHMLLWGGGNPFHHHQDINKLLRAWQKPDTVVVQEIFWTPVARHADIVLPTCSTLERDDIGAGWWDNVVYTMKQAVAPIGESRSDYAIVAALAERLGYGTAFTEGRDEIGWARFLYQQLTERLAEQQIRLPDFDRFWQDGRIVLPETPPFVLFEDFRRDPKANPLQTPSGKIEIFSSTIAGFGYADCPGHPTWLEPLEWLGSAQAQHHPLHLISNQPANRLHSQLDPSTLSIAHKIHGREPLWINPADAARRGIGEGDVVLVRNVRGSCLAGAHITDAIRLGVVQLATGAWYDPEEPGRIGTLDKHGNPNVLTFDKGTSKLAQGPSAHSVLVEVERWDGPVPAVTAHQPPAIIDRDSPKRPATLAKM
jgi:biotin/methionine sulfoxide reductase